MDWKNQYSLNDHKTHVIYRFNVMPIKMNGIFHRYRTKNAKICMKPQKAQNR